MKMFRNHKTRAQPFEVGYVGGQVIDQGGAYRSVLTSVMEEIQQEKVDCLIKSPRPAAGQPETFMLNTYADDYNNQLYRFLGSFLAFSLLTR